MEQPLRVKKMMTKRMKRGTGRVRKMKRTVRKTTPKKRAVWTRMKIEDGQEEDHFGGEGDHGAVLM